MRISLLGTGWLGFPLAKSLLSEGYAIKGATTSVNKLAFLQKEGITPHQLILEENGPQGNIIPFLENSNILIINIPPGLRRNPEVNFVAKIKNLIPFIERSSIQKVLFISSTSVFLNQEGFPLITSETSPNAISNAGKQLIATESLLQNNISFETTVLRFAGLYDTRRHPATMLSRRTNIKNPNAPVNLIHLNDCIGVIKTIIETSSWGKTFNAAYPDHPEKAVYYTQICKQMGLNTPDYDFETPSKGKRIDSKHIASQLGYSFQVSL